MKVGNQFVTALAMVASLGLVVPSTFGGSASADFSHIPKLNDPFTLHCDLNGDSYGDVDSHGDRSYVPEHYEVTYNFQSTGNSSDHESRGMFDPARNTSMTWRTRIDVLQADYEALAAVPTGYPEEFTDYTVEWVAYYDGDPYPHGKPKGRKIVRCVNIADPYEYTNSDEEAALDKEGQIAAGVPYLETDYQLFDVMLALGKGTAQAHHSHKHRHKH